MIFSPFFCLTWIACKKQNGCCAADERMDGSPRPREWGSQEWCQDSGEAQQGDHWGRDKLGIVVTRDKKLGIAVTRDKLGIVVTRDKLGIVVTRDKKLGIAVTRDKKLGIVVTRDKKLGIAVTRDKELGIVVTRGKKLGVVTRDKLGIVVTRDKKLGIAVTRDKKLGIVVTRDKKLGIAVTRDKELGIVVTRGKKLGVVTRDKLGIVVTRDMKLGIVVTRDKKLGIVVTSHRLTAGCPTAASKKLKAWRELTWGGSSKRNYPKNDLCLCCSAKWLVTWLLECFRALPAPAILAHSGSQPQAFLTALPQYLPLISGSLWFLQFSHCCTKSLRCFLFVFHKEEGLSIS